MGRRLHMKTLLICLTLAASFSTARSQSLVVGEGGQFRSVQDAINAAQPGDVIEVRPGTYPGNITLDKRLTLQGVGRAILRGSGEASVVVINVDGCTIRGLTIEHSGGDLTAEDSGILLKSNDNKIEDNELRDVLFGIYLYGSRRNVLKGNQIHGRAELESGERGAGLHLWDSHDNTIQDNVISEARDGLYIQSCTGNQIRGNRVFNLRYGLHYMNSNRNLFEDNYFSNNIAGAAIMYSSHIQLRRNAFVHNRGFSSFGILFQDCEELLAEENFIINNETGIFMEALRKTTFRRNVIAENDVAIQMFANSEGNVFTENNFVGNLSPLWLIGKSTTTRWADGGRGNFWNDYAGYDLDGNGTGDVQHKVQNIFEYMQGQHPRLRLYLNSPAAQALAAAEKSFPIVKGSSVADPFPLMKAVSMHYPYGPAGAAWGSRLILMSISIVMIGLAVGIILRGQPHQHES